MFNYYKITNLFSVITMFLCGFCYAVESTSSLDDAEKGLGNNIKVIHQDLLQQDQLNEYNVINVNSYITKTSKIFYQLKTFFRSIYQNIDQHIHSYCSIPIVQEYICQVASGVTVGIILYGIYWGLSH